MRRRLLTVAASLLAVCMPLMTLGSSAMAVDVFNQQGEACSNGAETSSVCQDAGSQGGSSTNPVINIIKIAINIVSFIVGLVSIIVIVISGIRMATSNGDAQAIANARNGILYALIGIAIVVFAEAFVAFVLNRV